MSQLLSHKLINQWPLFWLATIPMCAFMVYEMTTVNLSSGAGVSEMIGYSVRWAVPFIYLVAAASSMFVLFPGPFTRWWLSNRKVLGLIFAVAMGWQGLFIAMMSNVHNSYYYENIYLLRDEIEGSIGYLLLVAMVLTSFKFGRSRLTARQWKALHRTGVYFLWAYPFSVYWWNLFYYGNPDPIDYPYYVAGFLAFTVRIAAWGKRRRQTLERQGLKPDGSFLNVTCGRLLIAIGLVAAVTGNFWLQPVNDFLMAPDWSANMELWLPFWPLQPFLPLIIIGLGTMLLTRVSGSEVVPAAGATGTGRQ